MSDPVVAADEYTYDRQALEDWWVLLPIIQVVDEMEPKPLGVCSASFF